MKEILGGRSSLRTLREGDQYTAILLAQFIDISGQFTSEETGGPLLDHNVKEDTYLGMSVIRSKRCVEFGSISRPVVSIVRGLGLTLFLNNPTDYRSSMPLTPDITALIGGMIV
jgi:hypothetical protein